MSPDLLWQLSKSTCSLGQILNSQSLLNGRLFFTAHHNLGGVGAVDPDAHDEQVQDLGRNQVRLWYLFVVAPCNVGLHHCHAVHSERAGLVGADGRGVAHRLTGIQVADQVVVLHHFLKKEEGSVT